MPKVSFCQCILSTVKYPLPVSPVDDVALCATAISPLTISGAPVGKKLVCVIPNPVAVPELTIVAPEGTVNVSPESPKAKAVPVAGETLFVFTSVVAVIVVGKFKVALVIVSVAPDGIVMVSPEVPISKSVPVLGSTLSTFNVLIL